MAKRISRNTFEMDKPPVIHSYAAIGGSKEGEGPLGQYFDQIYEDNYFGQATWEKAEGELLRLTVMKALEKGKVKKDRDGRSLSIYPKGTRKRGGQTTRNAEIAFINEYGKRGQPARPAISTANMKKEKEATDAGERVYNQFLDSRNL